MGGSGIIAFISLFLVIFGIAYLYFSTRNKERMALIEKGADAGIFISAKQRKSAPIWKVLILNVALLLMGIGAGIVIGGILQNYLDGTMYYAMPGAIFLMAGTGLLIGFFLTKQLDKEED